MELKELQHLLVHRMTCLTTNENTLRTGVILQERYFIDLLKGGAP
jgi:hypothetical protein